MFVLGIVDGIIQKLDSLFLIGPYGYEEKVEIQEWIEVDSKQNYYALLIDQRFQEEIDQGYIFTNKNNPTRPVVKIAGFDETIDLSKSKDLYIEKILVKD